VKTGALNFLIILAFLQTIAVSYASTQEDLEQDNTPKIEFEARCWWPQLSGSLKAVSNDVGSGVDFKDDLGMEDEAIPEGRVTWHTGPNSWLRVSYLQASYEGENTLERTIDFNGRTFIVGTTVQSDADLKYGTLGWAWQFVNLADGKIKLGTLLEISAANVDCPIQSTTGLVEADMSCTVPVPAIGCSLNVVPWRWMEGSLNLSGLPLGEYGHTFNAEGGLNFVLMKGVSVLCGYRYADLDIEDDLDFIKMKFSGPFVAATLRF
jgi:hypothetical protein